MGSWVLMPVASLSLLGGQYFLGGTAANFGGRADAYVSPVVRIDEQQSLVPVYSGNYSGTQDIQELAGGSVLTRQRQSHTLSLAYAYQRDFDSIKPRLSYSKSLDKETTDETWGHGLFDTETWTAGVTGQHERWWGTLSESYDYYTAHYPNYSSLLSQSSGVLDPQTFTELSQNSGARVLDNENHRLGLGFLYYADPVAWHADYDATYRRFPDQAVVDASGGFQSKRRTDWVQNLAIKAVRDLKPAQVGLGLRLGALDSDQNSYDASRTQYIGGYYSYYEWALTPSVAVALKNGGTLYFETGVTQRYYTGRLAQDSNGVYSGSRTNQTTWLTTLSVRYPVMKHLFFRMLASYQASNSNMRYEADYLYNYQANTYALGFEWEL